MIDPKSAAGYRLGIVNPLTLVGTEIQSILRERAFPFDKVVLLDSTGTATGALTAIGDEPAVVLPGFRRRAGRLRHRLLLRSRRGESRMDRAL